MDFFRENSRLRELVAIVQANEEFFRDFQSFLRENGYAHVRGFILEDVDHKALDFLDRYMLRRSNASLYDGLLRPYAEPKAQWYLLSWMMRDAPAQRLNPLLRNIVGENLNERRALLLNEIRKFVAPLFPDRESWEWPAISEVMLARLEGSRRALKGTLFEGIVRRCLQNLFDSEKLSLSVTDREIRLGGETYDVQVEGGRGTILLPVKTRETMGGGHALLFTRDINKSIDTAEASGYRCIPVIIAESWAGDLDALSSDNYVWVKANPNEVVRIELELADRLKELISVFRSVV
ncbi:MAG: hypothetical protein WA990_02135 [Rubrobacteraceae bacterium]